MAGETFFREMTASTQEDWMKIMTRQKEFFQKLPDRILDHMKLLGKILVVFPSTDFSIVCRPPIWPPKMVATMSTL